MSRMEKVFNKNAHIHFIVWKCRFGFCYSLKLKLTALHKQNCSQFYIIRKPNAQIADGKRDAKKKSQKANLLESMFDILKSLEKSTRIYVTHTAAQIQCLMILRMTCSLMTAHAYTIRFLFSSSLHPKPFTLHSIHMLTKGNCRAEKVDTHTKITTKTTKRVSGIKSSISKTTN